MSEDLPICCTGEDSSPCCPGPALRERLAEVWDEGFAEGAIAARGLDALDNPYRD